MASRVRWDKYEAAVLLDAYVKTVDGILSRSAAVEKVSAMLRRRALLASEVIDDSYRNISGISYQFGVMQFAMTDGKQGIPQRSALFQDIVSLYRSNPGEFDKIFSVAERLSTSVDAARAEARRNPRKQAPDFGNAESGSEKDSVDALVDAIKRHGIKYTDKRSRGGCLWIIGGKELSRFVKDVRGLRVRFYYIDGGARVIGGQAGWWTKDYAKPGRAMPTSVKIKPASNVRPDIQKATSKAAHEKPNSTVGFRQWMIEQGLAESSARSYSSAINNAEQFAKEHGYADIRFYGNGDVRSVRQMIDRLFAGADFVAYNEGQHNRFRAAFRKFIDFVGSGARPEIEHAAGTQIKRGDALPSAVRDALLGVVAEGFPNGVRLGSVIDRKKIARLYNEKTGCDVPKDEDVKRCLSEHGITFGGKLYLISAATKRAVREQVEAEMTKGHRIFYYEELYSAAADYYTSKTIYSADALKRVIEESGIQLICYKNYCATARDVTIEDELVRAFGLNVQLTVDELKERLPFLPEAKLTSSLSLSKRFVRGRAGEYAQVDGIEINEDDIVDAQSLVEDEIAKHGFASLGNIDLIRTLGDNPMLSETAIRDAFFAKVLSRNYSKKGQIVTRTGESVSANDIMRESCRSLTSATLEELDDLEKSITGQAHNAILPIAFETMVRTDRDSFVSDELVDFDVEAVDDALDFFAGESIAPIKAISSFNSFPYVGQPWTLYLLESYVARFSKRYKISGGPARTDNVGAVYPKELNFENYGELLAHALAKSALDLGGSEAADYLIRAGFVLRKTALVRAAIERARTLRDFEGR